MTGAPGTVPAAAPAAVAAWVHGVPLLTADVDDREAALRRGRTSAVLPAPDSGEGRQLRRWLVQVLLTERLVAAAADRHGVLTGTAAATGTAAGVPPLSAIAPDRAALLELGSAAAALLADDPRARALFAVITRDVVVPPEEVPRFHAANPELFTEPESRVVRHDYRPAGPSAMPPDLDDRPLRTLRRGELVGPVEDAVFAARPGDLVGPLRDPVGWHTLRVIAVNPARVTPLETVRDAIERRLLGAARRRAFATWLDRERATAVRLAPGFEHPADPGQPDNTHRH